MSFPCKRLCRNPFRSLRATVGSAAISLFSMPYEIASVVSLPRNDIVTQSRKRESSNFKSLWTPAFAAVTGISAFYKFIIYDGLVKSRIFPFSGFPLCAGMTIKQLISNRYHRRHTREGGYPVFTTTFYEVVIYWAFMNSPMNRQATKPGLSTGHGIRCSDHCYHTCLTAQNQIFLPQIPRNHNVTT